MTLQKQTSLFTEEQFTFSAEDSHVNHTHRQESDLEKKMTVISGLKCLEQFEKFNHVGSWAKTFSALLIGMEGWYSKRCKLTWKLRGTKSNRMYFQLRPSALAHTEGIEFGLLPTPLDQMALRGLLPTPTAMDSTNATANMKSTQVKEGSMHSVTLSRAMAMGMLPTPNSRDFKDAQTPEKYQMRKEQWAEKGINLQLGLPQLINNQIGTPSHLSPQFVLEMMGFPTDWTELPFLNGETNQSKQEETQ